jgi:hypothetical protein
MINPAAWPKPLFEGWCEADGPAAAILMRCTAACFLFFYFCHHDEAAAESDLEALLMCLQAIACCSLQLSGKLLRCQASLCDFLCVST